MSKWQEFDDYMIYNEKTKIAIEWCTYGDDEHQYFLSQEFIYDDSPWDYEGDKHVLINEEITEDNTFEMLLEKTKGML
jgi:hypothetical protein